MGSNRLWTGIVVEGGGVPGRLTPLAERTQGVLDRMPAGRLWTPRRLATSMECAPTTVVRLGHELPDYWVKVQQRVFWGNRRTIVKMRKRLKAAG